MWNPSFTFREFLRNDHLVRMVMKVIVKYIRLTKRSENPRAEVCLRAERRGDCKIEALTASMFSDDLMGRGTPVLRRIVLPVCLSVVTHVTIDFRTGIWSHWAILKWFRKARWVATHYKKGGYDMLN